MKSEFLLISDLDDTLLGDDAALARFSDFVQSAEPKISLVYASGRFCDSIWRDVETTDLPKPAAVIGGVGSEIRSFPDAELNQAWVEHISAKWSAEKVRDVLADEKSMELQPEESQSDFKVSYFFYSASHAQLDRLVAKLHVAGIDANYIYSSDRDLDFLPAGVDKGTAAVFVARQLGYDTNRVAVAGNSGNDAKLFAHGFRGIIVANAHDDLKQLADDSLNYLSSRGYADGVREGLEYWIHNSSIHE